MQCVRKKKKIKQLEKWKPVLQIILPSVIKKHQQAPCQQALKCKFKYQPAPALPCDSVCKHTCLVQNANLFSITRNVEQADTARWGNLKLRQDLIFIWMQPPAAFDSNTTLIWHLLYKVFGGTHLLNRTETKYAPWLKFVVGSYQSGNLLKLICITCRWTSNEKGILTDVALLAGSAVHNSMWYPDIISCNGILQFKWGFFSPPPKEDTRQ